MWIRKKKEEETVRTVVDVPALFYRTVTADYRTIYKEIKNQDEKY